MKIMKLMLLATLALMLSACGEDKTADKASTEAAPAAESAMAEAAPMVSAEESAMTIPHANDEAEFELRRSIGGLDRMIEQYTADGHATDELEAQKAALTESLNALMSGS